MQRSEFIQAARDLPEDERAHAIAEAARALPKDGQNVVAREGIDSGVWPQQSRDRMVTILGSLLAALLAGILAIAASQLNVKELGTAFVALSTAVVGGIFGYAQASR